MKRPDRIEEPNMEMGSKKEIGRIEAKGEIYQCPSCGYQDGFHVSFRLKPGEPKGEVYLICPSCHSRFRMGWKISLSKDVKAEIIQNS
jgi:DNA-directed RNA polymerase subunit RPC12/RpoP